MKTFKIPVSWSVCAEVDVEAETLGDAIEVAREGDLPLPLDWSYIDDSWAVDEDLAFLYMELEENKEENKNENNNL